MGKISVEELANQMGIGSKEVLFLLQSIGVAVNAPQDELDESKVLEILRGGPEHASEIPYRPRSPSLEVNKPALQQRPTQSMRAVRAARPGSPETLTAAEVLKIHEILVTDFAASQDPISPAGCRSLDLLFSAASRQETGSGETLKYPAAIDNAATLMFGICLNHPFYNGNKRTALVSMLVHLDKNHLCLHGTSQKDLYDLMKRVASHTLGFRPDPRRPDKEAERRNADEEVAEISKWLRGRTDKVVRGERQVNYRQLRFLLARRGYTIENAHGNTIDVVRLEHTSPTLLRKGGIRKKRIGTMGYRDEGTVVSLKDLKVVRRLCSLSEEDGVDSASFYTDDAVIDAFVNKYRKVLRRLART